MNYVRDHSVCYLFYVYRYNVSVFVDDYCAVRDTNTRRFKLLAGTQMTTDVQEATNGKEALYLHLAGCSFDLVLMDNQMEFRYINFFDQLQLNYYCFENPSPIIVYC
jgi:CheY-like chemotaxis protein